MGGETGAATFGGPAMLVRAATMRRPGDKGDAMHCAGGTLHELEAECEGGTEAAAGAER